MEETKRKRGRPPKIKPVEDTEKILENIEEASDEDEEAKKITPKKQILMDYYNKIKNIAIEEFNIEPLDDEKFECIMCHRKKNSSDFFRSYSYEHIGTINKIGERHLPVCKKCSKRIFNYYLKDKNDYKIAINHWCETFDMFFSDEVQEATIVLHNSRKGTEMEQKFDFITDYVTALGRARMVDLTYWDSPYLQNKIKPVMDLGEEDVPIDISDKTQKDQPEEFENWDDDDLANYDYVLQMYKYDPFIDEPLADKKRLYYNLASLSDESITDDFSKANAAIDMCRSMQRLEKLNKLRINMENQDSPDIKEIKELTNLQKAEREAINRYGKEHGFILKYSMNKNRGSGTLTGILKQMDIEQFEDSLVNKYDIETSAAMQQAAEASWKAIFGQLNISESEFANIVKNQREKITQLEKNYDKLKETLRLANIQIKKMQLEEKLRNEGQ